MVEVHVIEVHIPPYVLVTLVVGVLVLVLGAVVAVREGFAGSRGRSVRGGVVLAGVLMVALGIAAVVLVVPSLEDAFGAAIHSTR